MAIICYNNTTYSSKNSGVTVFSKSERSIKERGLNSAKPASISYLENIFVLYGYTNGNSLGLEMEAIPGPFVMISLLCKC